MWVVTHARTDKDKEELRKKFYELPRAGLRSLAFLKEGGWLSSKRNAAKLAQLEAGTYVFDGEYRPFQEDETK